MNVRLTQLDGKLPNLALMKLSHWHRAQGDSVTLSRSVERELFEPEYDRVYGSAIFTATRPRLDRFLENWPGAMVGGTGTEIRANVEEIIGAEYEHYDYSIYPEYPWSLGFTARGCRLNCGFCVVPKKEGKPRSVNTIADIWRPGTPKCVCLLDNDFFGQSRDQWQARMGELQDGGFKVCFNQGINIRLIDDEAATGLASLRYYDDQFKVRRLYTAWDNLGDEAIFFRGVKRLEAAGIPPSHLMVYMLIGYRKGETMAEILYRFQRMVDAGIKPYPMVYDRTNKTLRDFQQWVIRRYYEVCSWESYRPGLHHSYRAEQERAAHPSLLEVA